MKPPSHAGPGVAALLFACHLLSASLAAQAATDAPAKPHTNPAAARSTPLTPPKPLPPMTSKTGIGFFRELLVMSPVERRQALTNYAPASQTLILSKVREYESLPPDERELRLRVTELHAYLRPLMGTRDTNRTAQLARIPEPDRELVEARLREWDKLAPEVQKALLEHEATLAYLAQIQGRTEEQRRIILTNIPPARQAMLEKGINKWNAMSEEERRQTLSRFKEFFELTNAEKDKALKTLSEPEQQQIEKTLRAFGRLRADQREACLRSFEKFTKLSLAERQQFLEDAKRWQEMSPSERQTWRELVRKMPPPLPPLPHPRPPLPKPAIATNGS